MRLAAILLAYIHKIMSQMCDVVVKMSQKFVFTQISNIISFSQYDAM